MNNRTKYLAFPFAAVLSVGLLAGCSEDTVVEEAEEEGPVAEAAILGETVTLQTAVQEIVGPNSFTVGGDETLVVGVGIAPRVEEGAEVSVSGIVRELVVADVESEYGIDFDDDEETVVVGYEEELVVVADEVVTLP